MSIHFNQEGKGSRLTYFLDPTLIMIATDSHKVPLVTWPRVISPPEVSLRGDTCVVVVVASGLAEATRMTERAAKSVKRCCVSRTIVASTSFFSWLAEGHRWGLVSVRLEAEGE